MLAISKLRENFERSKGTPLTNTFSETDLQFTTLTIERALKAAQPTTPAINVLATEVVDILAYTPENVSQLDADPGSTGLTTYRQGMRYIAFDYVLSIKKQWFDRDDKQVILYRDGSAPALSPLQFALFDQILYLYEPMTPAQVTRLLIESEEDFRDLLTGIIKLIRPTNAATAELLEMIRDGMIPAPKRSAPALDPI